MVTYVHRGRIENHMPIIGSLMPHHDTFCSLKCPEKYSEKFLKRNSLIIIQRLMWEWLTYCCEPKIIVLQFKFGYG